MGSLPSHLILRWSLPGRIAVFGVEDNGEGTDAPTDRITTIPDYDPPNSCDGFTL